MEHYDKTNEWVFQSWCVWENDTYDKFKISNRGGSDTRILYVSNTRLNNWTKVQVLHKTNLDPGQTLFWYNVHERTVTVHLEKGTMFEVTFDTDADMERFTSQLDLAKEKNEQVSRSAEPPAKRHRIDRGVDDLCRPHGGGSDVGVHSGPSDARAKVCVDSAKPSVSSAHSCAKSPRAKSRRRSDAARGAATERLLTTCAVAKTSEDAAVTDHKTRRGTQMSLKRGPALPPAQEASTRDANVMTAVSQNVRRKDAFGQSKSPKRALMGDGHSSYDAKRLDDASDEVDTTASGGGSTSTQRSSSNSPARFYHRSGSLRNMGNTCYLNASLQALRSITEFIECLNENPPSVHVPIYEETINTIRKLNATDAMDPIEPQGLRDAVIDQKKHLEHFSSMEQQDAHEFFNELVDRLHDDTKDHVNVWATNEYFTYQVNADLLCSSCGYQRTKKEEYRNLPLDFVRSTRKTVNSINGAEPAAGATADVDDPEATQPVEHEHECMVDINGLWDKFFEAESIEYKCEKCKGTECKMARVMAHYPKVLSLHLKRFELHFSALTHQYTYTKICDPVEIPDTLQLEGNFYELRSVVCHEGGRPDAGHYFCWVRSPGCGSHWTLYNDTYVHTKEDFPDEIKRKAYLVFYVKREAPPASESP